MNGWQRLFVVVSGVIILPPFLVWAFSKPQDFAPLYRCQTPTYVTIQEAKSAINSNNDVAKSYYSSGECLAELEEVASGEDLKKRHDEWWKNFFHGAIFIGVLLFLIYALGWCAGWVWRGFFPKRAEK